MFRYLVSGLRSKKIIRKRVVSSCIASVGYNERSKVLEVEFVSGAVYRYYDLPKPVYREFLSSASLGTYLNTRIKKHFRYDKTG